MQCAFLAAQAPSSYEFVNQELRDIVYILSLRGEKSIICDDTVSGKGSFLYAVQEENQDFDAVFDSFLYSNRLFVTKEENVWTVSKIKVSKQGDGKYSVQSYDSQISAVFERLSAKSGRSVVYETLPSQRLSFNIQNAGVYEIINLMLQPYEEYEVREVTSGIRITRKKNINPVQNSGSTEESVCIVNHTGELFSLHISNTPVSEVLEKLFSDTGYSYSNFLNGSERIKTLSFSDKDFEHTLMSVLEQVNAQGFCQDDMWYLFSESSRNSMDGILKRSRGWHVIQLKNFPSAKAIPLVTTEYQGIPVMETGNRSFAVYSTETDYQNIKANLERIDGENQTILVQLKHIKTSAFLERLPSFVQQEDVYDTGTGNSFYYSGNAGNREKLLEQLKEIDRPGRLVRYDLLILQYEKGTNLSWGISSSVRPMEMKDRTVLSGEIGNLLNINFDAITAFGLLFSEKINTAIAQNKAVVFADTTLYGLSGEKISFKNTNTYRYRDAAIDAQSGKESFSTITREITSGLVIEIDGWVSGDDVITMTINTSVSKQGVDVSKKSGNPPPTSEKNIVTKIRAKNGEPVVLSGLSQSDYSESSQGVPYVSDVPVLGNLFKAKDVSDTKTEMTIYILPHIEELSYEKEKTDWKELLLGYVRETAGK